MNNRLRKMLSYMRPHDTPTELEWTNKFIMPYNPEGFFDGDEVQAYLITVPKKDGTPSKVLFSAHVDTVHWIDGPQKIVVKDGFVSKKDGKPLGADDAAGCWILLEMIDAGVPGAYLFHRGEECGGIGSRFMAKNFPEWLSQFNYAIAFDRKATHSVITFQGGTRCCSEAFADGLSDALNAQNDDFMYISDDTGVFTDTKCYIKLIPECTNVSVGYYDEHRPTERLDLAHVTALRDACLKIDWESLPVKRDPMVEERKEYKFSGRTLPKSPWVYPTYPTYPSYGKPAKQYEPDVPYQPSLLEDNEFGDLDKEITDYFNNRYGRLM